MSAWKAQLESAHVAESNRGTGTVNLRVGDFPAMLGVMSPIRAARPPATVT
jgi:hypothetical protein